MKGIGRLANLLFLLVAAGLGLVCLAPGPVAALTVTPSTWNVIGLDSNTPAFGPNRFPVGAKVCGGSVGATGSATFTWDAGGTESAIDDTYIRLRAGSANPVSITYGADGCADAYFEVEVNKTSAAFDRTRRYHITAGGVSTPTPREIYVEHLVSQSRNGITQMEFGESLASLTTVANGGSMDLIKGNTYFIRMSGFTATSGYEQLESFVSFPNTIFQVLNVETTYTADTTPYVSSPNPSLYSDACLWENDPNSPNYLACNASGKAGGGIQITYQVKILSVGTGREALTSLIHDFSGSSFHYNADYSTSARFANLIDPALVNISKSFFPTITNTNGVSTLTFTLNNPNPGAVGGLNFSDPFPAGLQVADPPNATTSGCGSPTFAPAAGATSISFSNGTAPAYGSCTVKVNVKPTASATYNNLSNHLFVGTTDTGDDASATLTADTTTFPVPSPPATCTTPTELARWSMAPAQGTGAPPLFFSKNANVASATASFTNGGGGGNTVDATSGNPANSWAATGWAATPGTTFPSATTAPWYQFDLDTSKFGGARVVLDYNMMANGDWQGPADNRLYVYSSANGGGYSTLLTVNAIKGATWQTGVAANATSTGNNTTSFRINATGAGKPAATLYLDNVVFYGCDPVKPPTISKSFTANPVAVGATSTLTFTVTNPNTDTNAAYSFSNYGFSDTLPAGLTVTSGSSAQCGGTLTRTAPDTLVFTGGGGGGTPLAAGASCNITATVTATTAGPHDNVSGFVANTAGGVVNTNTTASGVATASLMALAPPSLAKEFDANPVLLGNNSTLTFTITNPNVSNSLSGVAFADTFPVAPGAMRVAATPNVTTSGCGAGAFSPVLVGNETTINFTNATIAAGATCTVSVNVATPVAGAYVNTSGNVSYIINAATVNGNTATDTLLVKPVNPAIALSKQVGPSATGPWTSFLAVPTGNPLYYQLTMENTGDVALSPVSVADPLVDTSGCVWPVSLPVAVAANDNHIAGCVVGPVTAVAGSHLNTATASGTYSATVYTDVDTARYATSGLTIAKSASENHFIAAGDTLTYSYLVANSGFAALVGPVTVADNKATATCPAVSTAKLSSDHTTGGDGDNYLDPGEEIVCSAPYTVTAADVTAKGVTNIASATVSGVTSPTATLTIPLAPDLTAVKTNNVGGSVQLGNSFSWTLTSSNALAAGNGQFADTQVVLSDDLPSSGATYAVGAVRKAGATGAINCAVAANTLTCTAGGVVVIPAVLPGATVAVTNLAAAVTGAGTTFTSQYGPGSSILIAGVPYTVLSITDDSNLTLTAPYAGATAAGLQIPGSFSVPVTVTTTAYGSLVNPRSGGVCQVDPDSVLPEIDETNNSCANTVMVQGLPSLLVVKTSQTYWDPINELNTPKPIPGAFVDYTIIVTNTGTGTVDDNSTVITDPIPANTELFVGDIDGAGPAAGPILFSDGATASGLGYTFTSLDSITDNLAFSANNGADYDKIPAAPFSNDCDPTVTNIKIPLSGIFNASDGANHPSFSVKFRVRIK